MWYEIWFTDGPREYAGSVEAHSVEEALSEGQALYGPNTYALPVSR